MNLKLIEKRIKIEKTRSRGFVIREQQQKRKHNEENHTLYIPNAYRRGIVCSSGCPIFPQCHCGQHGKPVAGSWVAVLSGAGRRAGNVSAGLVYWQQPFAPTQSVARHFAQLRFVVYGRNRWHFCRTFGQQYRLANPKRNAYGVAGVSALWRYPHLVDRLVVWHAVATKQPMRKTGKIILATARP